MSQPPLPPFSPGAVHITPGDEDTEFENGPDADLGTSMTDQDPNWDVPSDTPKQTPLNELHPNPLATAEEASRIAGAALHLCDANHVQINQKLYLKIEAWTGIARIAGAIPGIETVKDNVLGGVAGITARSTLKTNAGKLLSEAEGFVGNDEPFWATKPVSDRVNMAQTRAVGRVCRLVYSFIVQIMNKEYGRSYEVTPAEEMLASQQAAQQPPPGQRHVFQPGPQSQQYTPVQPAQVPVPNYAPPQPTFVTPQQWPAQVLPPTPQPNVIPYQQPQPQFPPPNVAPSVGQRGETWVGVIQAVDDTKWIDGKYGKSQLFIIHLTDGKNASTFDKTIAGQAMQLYGRNVEILAIPRGKGRYNIGQIRPL